MTVITGIYCSDGIVIAADGALTINNQIEQPYTEKVGCVNPNLMMGFAGNLGFAQRYKQVIKGLWSPDKIQQLEQEQTHDIVKAFCVTGIAEFVQTHPNNTPLNVPTGFLIGFVHKGQHHLTMLPAGNFQPEMIDDSHPFQSLGSGYHITNPFLSFIKTVYWRGKIPNVQLGIFSAIMALDLAIEINAGGINAPIHITVIQKTAEGYTCRKLEADEIAPHQDYTKAAIKKFSEYRPFDTAHVQDAPAIPTMQPESAQRRKAPESA